MCLCLYILIKLFCFEVGEHHSVVLLEQMWEQIKKRKADVAVGNLIPKNEFCSVEVASPLPKRRKKIESKYKKVIMSLIPENQVIQGNRDVKTPRVGGNEKEPLAPKRVEEENFESCLIYFSTWTVSEDIESGEKFVYGKSSADPFWMRTVRDMTPKDIVKPLLMNSVRVCSIYDLLRTVA